MIMMNDGKLPLNKKIKISIVTIIVRAVNHGNIKYYPQDSLNECVHEIWMENIKIFTTELGIL